VNRALARRIVALEMKQGTSRPDHARKAMAEPMVQPGLSNDLEIVLAISSRLFLRPLVGIHPNLPALYL
jgi:hypothetical protein